ncbi:hypothetical protein ACLOJK_038645, partial [Asimina triloba]
IAVDKKRIAVPWTGTLFTKNRIPIAWNKNLYLCRVVLVAMTTEEFGFCRFLPLLQSPLLLGVFHVSFNAKFAMVPSQKAE